MGALSQLSMWDVGKFFNGLGNKIGTWGGGICLALGAAMILVAIFKIGKGLMSDRAQTNWVMCFVLLFVGGIFIAGGAFGFIQGIAEGGGNELKTLGE